LLTVHRRRVKELAILASTVSSESQPRAWAEFDKLDDPQRGFEAALPFRLYNGRPGTTVADVISLLEQVRDRIRAQLRPKAD